MPPKNIGTSYEEKLKSELSFYREVDNVHDLPAAHSYIAGSFLGPLLHQTFGYSDFPQMIVQHCAQHPRNGRDLKIISLGSGNCDFEMGLASNHGIKGTFYCVEINPHMIARAREAAAKKGLQERILFIQEDINRISLKEVYDIVLVNHSLHHFVELEHLFEELARCMTPDSVFLVNDVIGRNGHLMWESTYDMVNRLWSLFPKGLKYNRLLGNRYYPKRLQWDCAAEGFEGVRAQDILPLLDKHFHFKDFAPFWSMVSRFIDRDFGHGLSPDNPLHKAMLDYIWYLDDTCSRQHLLRPTQLMAAAVLKQTPIKEKRFLYFEEAKEIYTLDESAFYNAFDSPFFTAVPRYTWGQAIRFGMGSPGEEYLQGGWRTDQPDVSWSVGKNCEMLIPVEPYNGAVRVLLRCGAFIVPGAHESQRVVMSVNGTECARWTMSSNDFSSRTIDIPADIIRGADRLRITLETPDAISPASLGVSQDGRILGLALVAMGISR